MESHFVLKKYQCISTKFSKWNANYLIIITYTYFNIVYKILKIVPKIDIYFRVNTGILLRGMNKFGMLCFNRDKNSNILKSN